MGAVELEGGKRNKRAGDDGKCSFISPEGDGERKRLR